MFLFRLLEKIVFSCEEKQLDEVLRASGLKEKKVSHDIRLSFT